jgi:hypothetical protein
LFSFNRGQNTIYDKPATGPQGGEHFQDGDNYHRGKAHNKRQNKPRDGNGFQQFDNNDEIRDGVHFNRGIRPHGIQDGGHFHGGIQDGGRPPHRIQNGGHFHSGNQDGDGLPNEIQDDDYYQGGGIQDGGRYKNGIQNGGHLHRGQFQNGKRPARPENPGRFPIAGPGENAHDGENFHRLKLLKNQGQKKHQVGNAEEVQDEHMYRVRIYDKQLPRPSAVGGGGKIPLLSANLGDPNDSGEDLTTFFEGGTRHFLEGGSFPGDGGANSAPGGELNNFGGLDIVEYEDNGPGDNYSNSGGTTRPGGHSGGRHRLQAGNLSSGEDYNDSYAGDNYRRRRFRGSNNGGLNRGPLVQDLAGGRPLDHLGSSELFLDNDSGPEFTGRPQRPWRIRGPGGSNNGGPRHLQNGQRRRVRNGGGLLSWLS